MVTNEVYGVVQVSASLGPNLFHTWSHHLDDYLGLHIIPPRMWSPMSTRRYVDYPLLCRPESYRVGVASEVLVDFHVFKCYHSLCFHVDKYYVKISKYADNRFSLKANSKIDKLELH